ncbi:aldehyde dehydrogenase [Zooshikella ganghwensis]|uniref:aldehyde dehydrogenase n=1 Tax=Zooshikella ganghwensis TaxID=202772 RepID=UPI0003F5F60A|nr:aldehyde dehydrogenase [Zooshikella ganghwensis]
MELGTKAMWEQAVEQLSIPNQAYIGGEFVCSQSKQTFSCINPANNQLLSEVALCDVADVHNAVTSASKVFQQGYWSRQSPQQRKKSLLKLADLIDKHADSLALLETLDMGKPIKDSRLLDIPSAANSIRWYAEAIDKIYGEIAPTAENQLGLITREPIGVVTAIVPWNFPLLMACWKIAPALAAGNSVILKPSEKSPLTAIKLAELVAEADFPPGVFHVLPGYGHTVGKALALHPHVDALAFTGSTTVAKQLLMYAGQSNMKRVWLEAGGKSPNIVFADSPDLAYAAEAAASAICFNQGEVCTAGSRLFVEKSITKEFLSLVRKAMNKWQPGNPLDPEVTLGAIVDAQQLKKIQQYIELGEKEGAELLQGGQRVRQELGGFFIQPALFGNVENTMRVAQDEIFGPVLAAITFTDSNEAVNQANDSQYGLAAGIWTSDLNKAHLVAKQLKAGSVWINHYFGGDMTAPFGGYKQSGIGRDKSLHAFDKYTEIKTTWFSFQG